MNNFKRPLPSNYRDQNHHKPSDAERINEKAQRYFPAIALLLDMDAITTDDIKKGINSIENLMNENDSVSTSQIRNIFKLIKDADTINQLNMIRPKLAYISARQRGDHGKIIAKVIAELIIKITDSKDNRYSRKIVNLKYVAESIVAYHKFYVRE